MSKSIVIAAAASALLFATPAFAQSKPHNPAFNGPHGSASDLTDRPSTDPTAARPHHPAFNGPHGSASDLTDRPHRDPAAARKPAFNGPHGSASDLTDRPPNDPTAAHIRQATLYGRKAGDDKRQDSKPAPRPLTKAGTGTLTLSNGN